MELNLDTIIQLIVPILTIIFGALSAYLRTNEKLRQSSIKYITEAEEKYKDITKSGGQKFSFVVDTLYNLVPAPLKFIITKSCVERIVQSTFDGIEAYAKTQIEKAIDKYVIDKLNSNEKTDG